MRERIAAGMSVGALFVLMVELCVALLVSPGQEQLRNHACDRIGGGWDEAHRRCVFPNGHVKMMAPPSPLDPYWWWALVRHRNP